MISGSRTGVSEKGVGEGGENDGVSWEDPKERGRRNGKRQGNSRGNQNRLREGSVGSAVDVDGASKRFNSATVARSRDGRSLKIIDL